MRSISCFLSCTFGTSSRETAYPFHIVPKIYHKARKSFDLIELKAIPGRFLKYELFFEYHINKAYDN